MKQRRGRGKRDGARDEREREQKRIEERQRKINEQVSDTIMAHRRRGVGVSRITTKECSTKKWSSLSRCF